MSRTTAVFTVLATMVLAPFFAGNVGSHDLLDPNPPAALVFRAFELPASWASNVFRHLQRQRLPIELADLESLLRVVDASARRFRLDPLMVLAVIRVESRFDPFAVSPAGSVGLMQLQLDTARDMATELRVPWTSDDLLFDPELNVLLGTCYLKQLLDRFGDPALALAAFHSGPSRILSRNLQPGPSSLVYTDRVWSTLLELRAGACV